MIKQGQVYVLGYEELYSIYMLSETKGLYYTTEFINHRSDWTADMDMDNRLQ